MKHRLLFLISFILILFSFNNVSASSIDYNLKIDENLHLHEKIVYNVDKKDVKNDGNYYFLTSIVKDPVYFDLNKEIKYKKTKKTITNGYLVTLNHDYSYLFLSKSRIVNECFVDKNLNSNSSYLSFAASDFYCAHRADNIKVSITTDLNVLNSNANSVNGNTYIWDNISNDFSINFRVQIPKIEREPMDDISDDTNSGGQSIDDEPSETDGDKVHINKHVLIGVIALLITGTFVVLIVLKNKNSKLNKI